MQSLAYTNSKHPLPNRIKSLAQANNITSTSLQTSKSSSYLNKEISNNTSNTYNNTHIRSRYVSFQFLHLQSVTCTYFKIQHLSHRYSLAQSQKSSGATPTCSQKQFIAMHHRPSLELCHTLTTYLVKPRPHAVAVTNHNHSHRKQKQFCHSSYLGSRL